jgi:stress-induced morphogen
MTAAAGRPIGYTSPSRQNADQRKPDQTNPTKKPRRETMTDPATARTDRLHATLTRVFAPTVLAIHDDSAHHAGHAGAQPGGQSHYSVLLVSDAFQGVNRVTRSRAVHAALASEFGSPEQGGMHALALTLRTPQEHAKQTASA